MPQTFTATAIQPGNHDWDFVVDEGTGEITALFVKGSVSYSNAGDNIVRGERLDIWPGMAAPQRTKVQEAYDLAKAAFDNHFLGS